MDSVNKNAAGTDGKPGRCSASVTAHESISVSRAVLLELVEKVLRAEIVNARPLIEEQIRRSMQLVDEDGALSILPIKGKDPRRSFRRLANKYLRRRVKIGGFTWFYLSDVRELMDLHTVRRVKASPRASTNNQHEGLRAVA